MPVTSVGNSRVIDSGVGIFTGDDDGLVVQFQYSRSSFTITFRIVEDGSDDHRIDIRGTETPGVTNITITNTGNSAGGGTYEPARMFTINGEDVLINLRIYRSVETLSKHIIYQVMVA